MSIMLNQSISMNGVKEARTNSGEGLLPGRCPTEQQGGPGRHRITAKGGSGIQRENVHDLERKRNV